MTGETRCLAEDYLCDIRTKLFQACDWLIDLGLQGGDQGGRLMFTGTPRALKVQGESVPARYLVLILLFPSDPGTAGLAQTAVFLSVKQKKACQFRFKLLFYTRLNAFAGIGASRSGKE